MCIIYGGGDKRRGGNVANREEYINAPAGGLGGKAHQEKGGLGGGRNPPATANAHHFWEREWTIGKALINVAKK